METRALAIAFFYAIGTAAGVVEIFLGVRAERRSLEDLARPLTTAEPVPTPAWREAGNRGRGWHLPGLSRCLIPS